MRTETQERTEMETAREKRDERKSVTDREKKPKKSWPPAQPRQVHATSKKVFFFAQLAQYTPKRKPKLALSC